MEFETLKKSHKKEIIIGVSIFILIGLVLIVKSTFAKYKLVKNIKIVEGTINYKVPDFKIMALYKNDGNGYKAINTMPTNGYAINESKSYCTLDNIKKDTRAKIYTDADGNHIITELSKNSKCYLYFDNITSIAKTTILANMTINNETPDFSKTAQATCSNTNTCETTNGLYKSQDDDGDTYYFRGAANNYVYFANKYWRIIRINGDKTIRLIYERQSEISSLDISKVKVAYNVNDALSKDNMYVGFKYTSGQVHGTGTKSTILTELEIWYKNNLAGYYASKIDTNAGFCNDREPSTSTLASNGTGGTGTIKTFYGPYFRLKNNTPTFKCKNSSDLFTITSSKKGNKSLEYPIGLITADEIIYAGGTVNLNKSFYLYNDVGTNTWTMSPYGPITSTYSYAVIDLSSDGRLHYGNSVASSAFSMRPVINLKADTKFTFTGAGVKGSITNPYVVS